MSIAVSKRQKFDALEKLHTCWHYLFIFCRTYMTYTYIVHLHRQWTQELLSLHVSQTIVT